NYNAGHFAYCYSRIGDFIPELVSQGCNPRVMLDYTGTLLWGFQQMGRTDILDKMKRITCDRTYRPYVEWLGTFWGHGIADNIPVPDVKHHIQAWRHHFADIFGTEALGYVRGFSPPKMQLPSHPDALYHLIHSLKACGYRWMLVKEGTVETVKGEAITSPQRPYQLVTPNSIGRKISITVLIHSQENKSSSVARMQPYQEAKALSPIVLNGKTVPPMITRIADGENAGVMMNEFPSAFKRTWHMMSLNKQGKQAGITAFNGTEYLNALAMKGIQSGDLPECQIKRPVTPVGLSHRPMNKDSAATHPRDVLALIDDLSSRFHAVTAHVSATSFLDRREHRYRNALLHNLLLQTSCFRSWGEGDWTEYAQEIHRRGCAILEHDF
ncbi:MAG: glycosyl hydrolase family 57, partial [Cyanobacteria bacterium P01_C01_bin.69]